MMLNCHQATQLLSQALDRPLSKRERAAMHMHLMICRGCRRCAMQFDSLRLTALQFAHGRGEKAQQTRHHEE